MPYGELVHEVPPGPDNPRNSEGAFLTLDGGRLLFAYSRFRGDVGSDDAPSDLVSIYSEDDGKTWVEGETIVTAEEHRAKNVMSVSFLRMRNGDVGLFYCIRAAANDARLFLRRSSDEGRSFSDAQACIEAPGYYVVNNDRVVRLSNGRLIIPAAFHRNGYDSFDRNRHIRFDTRGVDVFFVSDDDGVTWDEAPTKCALPHNRRSRSGLQEPGLLELSNGVLWAWARTDLCVQYEMFSFDSGDSWTTPEPSRFTSPQSPLSAERTPDGRTIVAVWNPIPNYNGRKELSGSSWTGGRTPLVLATSSDETKSWSEPVVIEDEADHGYCYTALHCTDAHLLSAYCAGGVADRGCLNRLRIRRMPLHELPT
jgi:sialidase-1